jgi:hypothetical protein
MFASGALRRAVPLVAAVTSLISAGTASAETLRAAPARTFVDSVGVNVHPTYLSTPYGNVDRTIAVLQSLGIRHVRHGIHANPDPKFAWVNGYSATVTNKLAAAGIKSDLVLGNPDDSSGTVAQQLAHVRTKMLGAVESFEGPNEWDQTLRANWAAELRGYQRALYEGVKADPALKALPVFTPSLGEWRRLPQLGDLSAYADYGNLHAYPGGLAPGQSWLDDQLTAHRTVTGAKKVMITEAGYHNAMAATGLHKPTSERASGRYVARMLLEHYRRGLPRTWLYELYDEKEDLALTNKERHFGLLRLDGSEKPAAKAVRNVIELAGTGTGGTAADLPIELTGAASGARRVAVRRPDGSVVLFLWQDSVIWDKYGQFDIYPAALGGTLKVTGPWTRAEVFSVAKGTAPTAAGGFTGTMGVTVPGDDIVAIRFADASMKPTPASGAPTLPPPPAATRSETLTPAPSPAAPAGSAPAASAPATTTRPAPATKARPSRRCRTAVKRAHRARRTRARAATRRSARRACGARVARRLLARAARAARAGR